MIITNNTELHKITKEEIHITNMAILHAHGIIDGNVHVEDGSTFYLNGILNGNLFASSNTTTYLSGTMNGSIISAEGRIELSGMLHTKEPVPNSVVKIKGCYINDTKY